MNKCDCYCTEEKIIGWHTPVDPKTTIVHKCNGTRERDECSCGGDRTKCDFYPEVREKALKEQEPKFGEWISVEEKLPNDSCYVLVRLLGGAIYEALCLTRTSKEWCAINGEKFVNKNTVTHWMPLPTPPTK